MAHLAKLYGVSQGLHGFIPKAHTRREALPSKPKCLTTRRFFVGFSSIGFLSLRSVGLALAEEENRWWSDGPLRSPTVENKIANEETGTRSFLKEGIYIADITPKGRMYRIYKYAFDLLAMGDLIGQDAWPYIRRYLRLKSTIMYYDFDQVISAARLEDKQPLTDLANKLFNNFEELLAAVKNHDLPKTQSCYQGTSGILDEVMARMPNTIR